MAIADTFVFLMLYNLFITIMQNNYNYNSGVKGQHLFIAVFCSDRKKIMSFHELT